jgi:hypothetical protein
MIVRSVAAVLAPVPRREKKRAKAAREVLKKHLGSSGRRKRAAAVR